MKKPADSSDREHLLNLAQLLVERLERLSADSSWARRASGVRGTLLKVVDEAGSGKPFSEADICRLRSDISWAFYVLEKAARELG